MWDFAASIHDHFTCNKYFLNDGFWFFFSFRINPCVWFEVGILYFQRTVILCALSCPSTRRFHDAGTAPSGSSCVANMSNHSGPDESLHRYTKMNFIGSLLCLLTIAGTFQTAKYIYIYIYDFIYINMNDYIWWFPQNNYLFRRDSSPQKNREVPRVSTLDRQRVKRREAEADASRQSILSHSVQQLVSRSCSQLLLVLVFQKYFIHQWEFQDPYIW